jgi:hypothetical protein
MRAAPPANTASWSSATPPLPRLSRRESGWAISTCASATCAARWRHGGIRWPPRRTGRAPTWPKSPLAAAAALLSASTFHLSGRHAEAIAEYTLVERKYHGTQKGAEALFEKGSCLAELGDDEGAVKAYTDALSRHDSPDAVQFALERAERRLERGRAVNPHNMAAVWDRGLAQRRASTH